MLCSTNPEALMSLVGQQRSSNDVCVTSAITQTAAGKRTFRHFAFVPLPGMRERGTRPVESIPATQWPCQALGVWREA
jgi:hypothetical protein